MAYCMSKKDIQMTIIPSELLAYLANEVDVCWFKKQAEMPRWFTIKQNAPLEKLSAESWIMLLKAKAEGLLTLTFSVTNGQLWHHLEKALKNAGFDTPEDFEKFWPELETRCKRQLFHEYKLKAEGRLIENSRKELEQLVSHPLRTDAAFIVIECGLKSGLKLACCNPSGEVITNSILFPHEPQNQWQQSLRKLNNCVKSNRIKSLVIATGEGYRETRKFIKTWLQQLESPMQVYRVSAANSQQLSGRVETNTDDTLYQTVNVLAKLAVNPLETLSVVPARCLLKNPLLTTVNQQRLNKTLDDQWQKMLSDMSDERLSPDPLFQNEPIALSDLKTESKMEAFVVNQTDYGYFLDVGIMENGLLHKNHMPHDKTLIPGEVVTTSVINVNHEKNQFSLGIKAYRKKRNSTNKKRAKPVSTGNSAMADALKAAFKKH